MSGEQLPRKMSLNFGSLTLKKLPPKEKPKPTLAQSSSSSIFESTVNVEQNVVAISEYSSEKQEARVIGECKIVEAGKKIISTQQNVAVIEKITKNEINLELQNEGFYDPKKYGLQIIGSSSTKRATAPTIPTSYTSIFAKKYAKVDVSNATDKDAAILAADLAELPDEPIVYDDLAVEDFGNAMLEKMGWKEGMGLGKRPNTAIVEPVELKSRPARLGLGAEIRPSPTAPAKSAGRENVDDAGSRKKIVNRLLNNT